MVKSARWDRLKSQWAVLSFYQRFESAVAMVLTFVIGLIILVALFRLTLSLVGGLLWGALDQAGELLGLAAITLALGIVYWLMRERDDRLARASEGDPR